MCVGLCFSKAFTFSTICKLFSKEVFDLSHGGGKGTPLHITCPRYDGPKNCFSVGQKSKVLAYFSQFVPCGPNFTKWRAQYGSDCNAVFRFRGLRCCVLKIFARGRWKRGTLKVWEAWRNISAVTMLRQGVFEQWFAMWAPALLWDVRQRGWTSGSWLTHLPQRHSDDRAFVLTSYKTWITFSFTVLLCASSVCCMCYLLWSIINF